jgi:hypothetical protein
VRARARARARVKASPAGPKTAECSQKLNLLHGTSKTDINIVIRHPDHSGAQTSANDLEEV